LGVFRGFTGSIVRAFTRTRSRRGSTVRRYLEKNYPRVYRLLREEVARGKCPLCGKPIARPFVLASHLKNKDCAANWATVASAMHSSRRHGFTRLPEDQVLGLVNQIRARYGLPSIGD